MNKILRNLFVMMAGLLAAFSLSAQCVLTLSSLGEETTGFQSGEVDIHVNGNHAYTWDGFIELGQVMKYGVEPGDFVEFFYRADAHGGDDDLVIADCNGNTVFRGGLSPFAGQIIPFAQHVVPTMGDSCPYSIAMVDSDVDVQGGWDGFTLDVFIDGAFSQTITLASGHSGFEMIMVPNGASITVEVSSLGNFPTEVGFSINNASGITEFATSPSDWNVTSDLGIVYTSTASCRAVGPCMLECPFTGSGAFDPVFNLGAGQCCAEVEVPINVTGDCFLYGDPTVGLSDILCTLEAEWDAAECSDTGSNVDASAGTITLVDDVAPLGLGFLEGCGSGQAQFEWVVSADGTICFDYEVTGSSATFNFYNNSTAFQFVFIDSGSYCVDVVAGTNVELGFSNGSASGDNAVFSNFNFRPYVQLAVGPFNYLTEVCSGDTEVELTLTGSGAPVSCSVPITVNDFSGQVTSSLFCNDGVNVSVDGACCVTFDADMFLEGGPYSCFDDYMVRIRPGGGDAYLDIDSGSGTNFNVNGETLCDLPLGEHIYEVVDVNTGNLCWGTFLIEDKLPPTLQCDCSAPGEEIPVNGYVGELSEESPTTSLLDCASPAGVLSNVTPFAVIPFTVECDGQWAIRLDSDIDMSWLFYDAYSGTPDCSFLGSIPNGDAPTATLFAGQQYHVVVTSTIAKQYGEFTIKVFNIGNNKCEPVTVNPGIARECTFLCSDEFNWGVLDALPMPTVVDNCGQGELVHSDVWTDGACGERILTRSWVLTSGAGEGQSVSSCVQTFMFDRLDFDDVMLPGELVELDCAGAFDPATLLAGYEAAAAAAIGNFNAGLGSFLAGDPSKEEVDAYAAANWPNLAAMAMDAGFGPFYKEQIPLNLPSGYPACYVESIVPVDGNICNIYVSYEDVSIPACGDGCPGNEKVIRTWTILDWCDSSNTDFVQVIKSTDNEAPQIQAPASGISSVDPWTCKGNYVLPCPTLLKDACSGVVDYMVVGPQGVRIEEVEEFSCGDNGAFVAFDLAKAMDENGNPLEYVFTYIAFDCCGNETELEHTVIVVDQTPPVAQVKQNTVISLTSSPQGGDGSARITWESINNGSYDLCSDVHIEIRREDGAPACDNVGANGHNNNVTFNNDEDDDFAFCSSGNNCGPIPDEAEHTYDFHDDTDGGQFVKFCCEDLTEIDSVTGVMYGMVKVYIRVWDDGNMTNNFGDWVDINGDGDFNDPGELDNYADLWAYVRVEDKLAPQISCPKDVTLKCDDIHDTSITGVATSSGTCTDLGMTYTDSSDLDACGAGVILRTWCVEGTNYCCTQKIVIEYQSTWDECSFNTGIIWPNDFTGARFPEFESCSYNDATNAPNVFGTTSQRPRPALDCRDTDTGEPDYSRYRGCDLIGHALETDTFVFEDGACYKVLNTWKVINWCIYNPGDADWNDVEGEGLDLDGDGIVNLQDIDDDGDGNEDSYYTSGNNRRYYLDEHGGIYWVLYGATGNYISNGRDYSIDIWDLDLVSSDGGYFGAFDPNSEDDGIADGLYEHVQVIKFVDTEAPTITTEEEPCFAVSSDAQAGPCSSTPVQLNCEAFVTLTASADDSDSDCPSNWLKWHVQIDMLSDWSVDYEFSSYLEGYGVNSSGNIVPINCPFYLDPTSPGEQVQVSIPAPIGASKIKHRVIWTVEDGCNNVTSYETWFTVEDKKAPTPYCVNLSSAVMDNGTVELWACDFDQGAFDNCSTDLKFTFDGPAEGFDTPEETNSYDPATQCQGKWFSCNDIENSADGFVSVKVYVWDECNNVDFCMVNLRLIDNQGGCDDGGTDTGGSSRIAGHIYTEEGLMIEDVEVENEVMNNQTSDMRMTDFEGEYVFEANQTGLDYSISPTKNVDPLNGVSTLDLVLIQKHILGTELLDTPYKRIAADANNDQRITGIDLVEIRKLILGLKDEFSNNTSWRFADSNLELDIDNPWLFDEQKYIAQLSDDIMDVDFIGIKVADVNGSVTVASFNSDIEGRSGESLQIEFIMEKDGENTIFRATSPNFNNIYGFQFTLDVNDLNFEGVQAGTLAISNENFGVVDNNVTVSWNSKEAISSTGELFALTFTNNGSDVNALEVTSTITTAEAYKGSNYEVIDVEAIATDVSNDFVLRQNEPNPFKNNTAIGFVLPEDGQATLTVYDVTGKVISTVKGDYIQGYNEIELSEKDMNASGVLYYKLESGEYTATKKMIILD